jgi:hypothetical protein
MMLMKCTRIIRLPLVEVALKALISWVRLILRGREMYSQTGR